MTNIKKIHLRQKIHGVFATAVDLRVPLLAAKAFHFGDRHALDADSGQSFFHFLEFEGLDDGDNEFHA